MNELIGIIALLLAAISYGLYIRNTLTGHTKPHAVTWLIWGTLNGFIFTEQVLYGAGPGAWVTGGAAIANIFIFALAMKKGERTITLFDWFCLGLVGIMLGLWFQIEDPTLSMALAVLISLLGLIPTIIKATKNPHEETALSFLLNGIKFLLALTALTTVTVATALYPLSLFVMDTAFAIYLIMARRSQGTRAQVRVRIARANRNAKKKR